MVQKYVAVVVVTLLMPVVSWAGAQSIQPAPTLGEIGLIGLGAGLVGVGAAFVRTRKR